MSQRKWVNTLFWFISLSVLLKKGTDPFSDPFLDVEEKACSGNPCAAITHENNISTKSWIYVCWGSLRSPQPTGFTHPTLAYPV
jgi:hypothetical protein